MVLFSFSLICLTFQNYADEKAKENLKKRRKHKNENKGEKNTIEVRKACDGIVFGRVKRDSSILLNWYHAHNFELIILFLMVDMIIIN